MVRSHPTRARRREALVLLAGGLTAGVLLLAAGVAVPDRDAVGEAALVRATSEVVGAVRARWQNLLRRATWPWPEGGLERERRWVLPLAVEPLPEGGVPGHELPEARGQSVFDLLLGEAQRAEGRGELEGALSAVEEALERFPEDPRAPEAHLVRLRLLARGLRDLRADTATDETSREAVEARLDSARSRALAATDPQVMRDGFPMRVLLGTAAGRPLELPAELDPEWLLDWHADRDRLEPEGPYLVFRADPDLELVLGQVTYFWTDAFRARRRGRCLARALSGSGALESVPGAGDARKVVRALGRLWCFEHVPAPDPYHELIEVSPEDVQSALLAEGPLAAGFVLEVAGATRGEGEVLREGELLDDDLDLRFRLRHPDPGSVARAGAGHLDALRLGLLVMALAVGGGALVTARALARERRVAELKAGFVAGVSHDLRTPLASILLMAENLEQGRVPAERAARYHGSIRREAERLRRLVDDVLDLARVERGEAARVAREEVDLVRLSEDLSQEARERVELGGGTLEVRVGSLPDHGSLDVDALRRALGNLLDNGLRHGGGRLTLWFEHLPGAGAGRLRVAVEDRGPGVPAARREALFAPFERGTREAHPSGGTGLGLAIVRAVARAHGGDATMREAAGGGCRVELLLALDEDAPAGPGGMGGSGR